MSQFIESIRFEDGEYHLLSFHQDRVNRAFAAFFSGQEPLNLEAVLPSFDRAGKFKFRVIYDQQSCRVEHAPYSPKLIKSVKLVEANELDYSFKYADRTELNEMLKQADADEIIIVKNGFITDTTYANIACFDGHDWWTPGRPLLNGTKRADLLNLGILKTRNIRPEELGSFQKVCIINAMLNLDEIILPL